MVGLSRKDNGLMDMGNSGGTARYERTTRQWKKCIKKNEESQLPTSVAQLKSNLNSVQVSKSGDHTLCFFHLGSCEQGLV